MRIRRSIVSRYHRFAPLAALVLVVGCTHVGHGPVQVVSVEPPPPEKAGPKIAPRAFESMRAILEQTAAVVEGDVSDIAFDYDDCAGPRTKVKVVNTHSVLGTTVATEIVLSIFGSPMPDGRWFRASKMPRFALGPRYVFFIRNTDWTFAPIIGELAYRVEIIAGRSVLVNGNGQTVTGLFESGIETNTVALTEPTGNRYRALRPEAGRIPDESRFLTTTMGTAMGLVVAEHELGHAMGLEHSTGYAIMRDGTAARVPFVGSSPGSGGSRSYYVGDDVYGLQYLYGVAPFYRNLFASSQLLRNNVLIYTASDPGNGDMPYTGVIAKCPGDSLGFYVSVGNTGTQLETTQLRIYADDPVAGYGGAVPGTTLQTRSNVTVSRYGAFAFPVTVTIPPSIPRDTNLSVFVDIDSNNTVNERKEYDNRARSVLMLRVGNVAACGR